MTNAGHHGHPCEEQLAFFGKIGADTTHEMRNVLSVIGEYAGLLDDMLALAERGNSLDYAKLKKLCAKMTGQVGKGTEAMERFSRFAHAADRRTASCDLTALAGNMAALAQRQVTLAGCRLEVELPDEAMPVRANPFSLQHAVFSAIEIVLESEGNGELITVKLAAQGNSAVMTISRGGADPGQLSDRVSQLSAGLSELGASVETSREDEVLSLILSVPTE